MSFAALGLFGVVTFGAALTVLVVTLTALGVATLRVRLLRGAVGLVAVATVMKEIHLNSSIIQKKIAPKDDLVIN